MVESLKHSRRNHAGLPAVLAFEPPAGVPAQRCRDYAAGDASRRGCSPLASHLRSRAPQAHVWHGVSHAGHHRRRSRPRFVIVLREYAPQLANVVAGVPATGGSTRHVGGYANARSHAFSAASPSMARSRSSAGYGSAPRTRLRSELVGRVRHSSPRFARVGGHLLGVHASLDRTRRWAVTLPRFSSMKFLLNSRSNYLVHSSITPQRESPKCCPQQPPSVPT